MMREADLLSGYFEKETRIQTRKEEINYGNAASYL